MPDDAPAKPAPAQQPQGLGQRLAWFLLLWLAGVTAVGVVSLAIKWALK